jgi:hypothetical protein
MDTLELKGLTFRVDIRPDDSMGAPWDEHDGHGPVRYERAPTSRDAAKSPGERVLCQDRGTTWLYDWQGAMRLAKRDGWGLSPEDRSVLAKRLGRDPVPGEVRVAAVQRDYDYCRQYLEGYWYWCGVVVTLLDTDGEATRETESLWGMESEPGTYLEETARELAAEIARRVGRRKYIETRVRVRT